MKKDKKSLQLGMNPSTAAGRLTKDILWSLVVKTGQSACCKCGEPMSRETFSIEHVTPWLDSEDPVGLYFDLENVSFSHLRCNIADARKPRAPCGTESAYSAGCRCDDCKVANTEACRLRYNPGNRQNRYRNTGH